MFRQGLRRCAAASRSGQLVISLRTVRQFLTNASTQQVNHYVSPLKAVEFAARNYSTEADAQQQVDGAVPATGEITSFAALAENGVHPNLLRAIVKDMGYDTMTPVQAKTINPALKGTDIVAQAKTGTGKTLAFLLPLLQRMIEEDPTLASRNASRRARSDDVRGIILSPTRELAEQIATEARRLVKYTGLVVQSAVGGTQKSQMLRQTQREGCHLLVATPGRLNDLLGDPRSGIEAPNLAAMVLDEADRMLDVGFENELNEISKCLPSTSEKVRQTMLVSATIPDDVIRLARTMVRPHDFEFVQTIAENDSLTHENIPQNLVSLSGWTSMFPALLELIDRETAACARDRSLPPFKAIVYFNNTAMVQVAGELGFQRRRSGAMTLPTFSIHSQLTQGQRTRAAEQFRKLRSGVLFSSDVTARGMDFPDVTHVIQMDVPRDRESYIHRLGRTGRQNKGGEGWLFLPPNNVPFARRSLQGLPLVRNTSLENATIDLEKTEELPAYYTEIKDLMSAVPRDTLNVAYKAMFGGQHSLREDLVNDLNTWATKGWGWSEPPAVSRSWAHNQGLMNAGLNIQQHRFSEDEFSGSGRSSFRSRDRTSERRGDRGSDRRSSDPFSSMAREVRREGPPSRGGFKSSGGYRGPGGSRDSGSSRSFRGSSF